MTEERPPHLFQCLTREEFKVCWAFAFCSRCAGYEDSYDLGRYATPSLEGDTSDWLEIFKRVIRLLHLRHGYSFTGLLPQPDGEILAKQVEERNYLYVTTFKMGQIPDPPSALRMALDDPQIQECGINLEPLRACLDDVEEDVRGTITKNAKEAPRVAEVNRQILSYGRKLIDDAFDGEEKVH